MLDLGERTEPTGSPLAVPAIASAGAAILHAAASGIHADHPGLARIFIALAVAQGAVAVLGLLRGDRRAAVGLVAVNLLAAAGWLATRLTGFSFVGGLEVAERPQLADTVSAVLAVVAVIGSVGSLAGRQGAAQPRAIVNAAVLAGVLVVPGLVNATSHDHDDHDAGTEAPADDHGHTGEASVGDDHTGAASTGGTDDHTADDHAADDHAADDHAGTASAAWPRPWDPTQPIDFSGVPGVTTEQQARAEQLVADALRELPQFADVDRVGALGYRSIGDASTGFEHYINRDLIADDTFLDPTAPESLVYRVDGDARTLVSAMFIANEMPIDDPTLTGFAGPLMQWHVHLDLCWGLDDQGNAVVKGVLEDFGGTCPAGTVNAGGENPMVHVWIAPHECGPFAALEGHGAGQASVSDGARMDQCGHDHATDVTAAATMPYDPALPIDLGGIPGVTPEQQAFAENLVAATVRDLPQWADLAVVEAAGFHSIGDGATGHEHYINWDWIDDDVWLDPDHPESLVFEPQPDGTKKLVSAMFMLPGRTPLEDVPDWGGALMQWHVHGDLCFTDDPVAPQVAGLKPVGEPCRPPLVDGTMAPMIHVWITPHECGPFAALEGVGGGQVPEGEAVLCDHAHGSG